MKSISCKLKSDICKLKLLQSLIPLVLLSTSAAWAADDQVAAALAAVRVAALNLHNIEESLEQGQDEDSPLALAKAKFEKARGEHQELVEKILQSPAYKAALEELGQPGERPPGKVAELRETMVTENSDVREAAARVKEFRETYLRRRDTLFQADTDWREASQNLKALRQELSATELAAKKALAHKNYREDQAERARRQAALEQLVRQQNEIAARAAAAAQKQAKQAAKNKKDNNRKGKKGR